MENNSHVHIMTNVCVFACSRAHVRTCVCLYMCVCMVWYSLPISLLPSLSPCLADHKPNIGMSLVFRLSLSPCFILLLSCSLVLLSRLLFPHSLSHCSCRFMYETMTGRDTPSIGGHRQRHTLTGRDMTGRDMTGRDMTGRDMTGRDTPSIGGHSESKDPKIVVCGAFK